MAAITVRVPEELAAKVRGRCIRENLSLSGVIRDFLGDWVEGSGQPDTRAGLTGRFDEAEIDRAAVIDAAAADSVCRTIDETAKPKAKPKRRTVEPRFKS